MLALNASYDFEPIYQAPAGVINPGERAKNEMSLNSKCWNSKENKKGMLFCYFFSFASLQVAPDVGLGFITCNYPLKSFLFRDDNICVVYLISISFFKEVVSRATRISIVCYITIYMSNAREPAVEGFVTCYDYFSLDFSVSHVFHWLKFRESKCWLQHSYSMVFNFLSIDLFWYKPYAGGLLPPVWVMVFKLCSAPHAQSETKHEAPACLFHMVLAVRSQLCWIGSIAQYHYSLRSTEHFLDLNFCSPEDIRFYLGTLGHLPVR